MALSHRTPLSAWRRRRRSPGRTCKVGKRISRLSFWRLAGVAAAAGLLAAACGTATEAGHTKTASGGVVTFAELPSTPPLAIDPLMNSANFSVVNISQFQEEFYRPLFWFGDNGQPVFNPALSLAYQPVFSDNNQVATVTMKHWQWSNGQPVTARDVVLWMNLLSAVTDPNAPAVPGPASGTTGPGWGAAVTGGFPSNLISYTQTGEYTVVFKFNASYNPRWVLYNELSQITPMPQASWDELSATGPIGTYDASAETRVPLAGTTPTQYYPANPGTANSGALGVAAFLNDQSYSISTYQTNPLWKVVDGPFTLNQYTTSGFVKMTPNTAYSGSPKPTISALELEPFQTDTSEFNELKAGKLTVGYIPLQDLKEAKSLEKQQGYKLNNWNDFGIVYFAANFTSPKVGPMLKQLYFRRAMQDLLDQTEYIKDLSEGVGTVGTGPVPTYPAHNVDESPLEGSLASKEFSTSKAVSLLKSHGWKVKPGGTSYCAKPGTGSNECGAGVKKNTKASFTMLYANGVTVLENEMDAMKSTMEQYAGINIQLTSAPFATVTGTAFGGCTQAKPCTNWELADWGGGWVYSPDYYPTGGELFSTGASANAGDYSSSEMNTLIEATHTAPTAAAEKAALVKYQDYAAQQLPIFWMPSAPYQVTMYKSNLKGLVPQDPYDQFYPENYSLG